MAWQIALQLVRQGASDEPEVAHQIESPTSQIDGPNESAVVEAQVAETDEAKVEDVDKLDQNVVASESQTASESLETDLPVEPAVGEVQVADTDEPMDSKVSNSL